MSSAKTNNTANAAAPKVTERRNASVTIAEKKARDQKSARLSQIKEEDTPSNPATTNTTTTATTAKAGAPTVDSPEADAAAKAAEAEAQKIPTAEATPAPLRPTATMSLEKAGRGYVWWVPDNESNACALARVSRCNNSFRCMCHRRHHCRSCGVVVCSSCSTSQMKLTGFGMEDEAKMHRVCNTCATATNAEIDSLRNMWEALHKASTGVDDLELMESLARSMAGVWTAKFTFARGAGASTWRTAAKVLKAMLKKEIGICDKLLNAVLSSMMKMTVQELDEQVLNRVESLSAIFDNYVEGKLDADIGFALSRSFEARRNDVIKVRDNAILRNQLHRHERALYKLVNCNVVEVPMFDIIEAWGLYQAFRETKHMALPVALEAAAKETLNKVIHRELIDVNDGLARAIKTRNVDIVRKAVEKSDSLTALLFNNTLFDMVMPDIHVVIPGFASNRRKARDMLMKFEKKEAKKQARKSVKEAKKNKAAAKKASVKSSVKK